MRKFSDFISCKGVYNCAKKNKRNDKIKRLFQFYVLSKRASPALYIIGTMPLGRNKITKFFSSFGKVRHQEKQKRLKQKETPSIVAEFIFLEK